MAVIVALTLVGLIGFVGLALDLGKLFIVKTELQNSVDACALAAARELTGFNLNQLVLAEAAGRSTGERHNVYFQGEKINISSVTFSEHLAPFEDLSSSATGSDAARMHYARCEATRTGIANWFIQVLNLMPGVAIGDQTVAANAVATLAAGQTVSSTDSAPIAICNTEVLDSQGKEMTSQIGQWLQPVSKVAGGMTGNYGWADIAPGVGGSGASKLSNQLTARQVLFTTPAIGSRLGATGFSPSLADAWNTRFGIYSNSFPASDVANKVGIPDKSGYAYTTVSYPAKQNAFINDFINKRSANEPYQGQVNKQGTLDGKLDPITGLSIKGTPQNNAFLQQYGSNRRTVTAPIIDCQQYQKNQAAPIVNWACIFMLHPIADNASIPKSAQYEFMWVEFLGLSGNANNPCTSQSGIPAGPSGTGPKVPTLVR